MELAYHVHAWSLLLFMSGANVPSIPVESRLRFSLIETTVVIQTGPVLADNLESHGGNMIALGDLRAQPVGVAFY